MMYLKSNELLLWTYEEHEPLDEFFFARREWKGMHDSILEAARMIDLRGLHAAEGGFDLPSREDRYCDARYGMLGRPVMSLWRNGLQIGFMWALRVIFRMHGIATFDNEAEAIRYATDY